MMRFRKNLFLLALLPALLAGCTSMGKKTPGSADTFVYKSSLLPAKDEIPVFNVINDPLEPMNRAFWAFNEECFQWVLLPFNRAYAYVLPESVRECVSNFQLNIAYPVRLINTALQGKFQGSLDETYRFGINTTVGILGIFDPATTRWQIPAHREDFGQTFGFYGNKPGFFIMIPFIGPTSWRDGLGRLLDMPFDATSWLIGARPFFGNNDLSFNCETYACVLEREYDTYNLTRDLWAIDREKDVRDYVVLPDVSDPEPSLGNAFLKPHDEKFFRLGEKRQVQVPNTGRKIPYNIWLQEGLAPLLVILPGIGAHRVSSGPTALAEMAYRNGYSVVTISSAMNWEFMEAASTVAVPGYTPSDCQDLVHVLNAIRRDAQANYPDRFTWNALMGYSMGGLHTLYLASMEARGELGDLKFDRYLAINPPVSLTYAMKRLDDYYKAPLRWRPAQRRYGLENTLLKAVTLARGELHPNAPVELSRAESEFLIGLVFRIALRDVIFSSQKRNNLGVLGSNLSKISRQNAYEEIGQYSYTDYMEKFAVPYIVSDLDNKYDADQIKSQLGLENIEPYLRENKKIRVHINEDDFLLRPSDADWLQDVLGDRLVRFSGGGHLGNLHVPEVQDKILESLSE